MCVLSIDISPTRTASFPLSTYPATSKPPGQSPGPGRAPVMVDKSFQCISRSTFTHPDCHRAFGSSSNHLERFRPTWHSQFRSDPACLELPPFSPPVSFIGPTLHMCPGKVVVLGAINPFTEFSVCAQQAFPCTDCSTSTFSTQLGAVLFLPTQRAYFRGTFEVQSPRSVLRQPANCYRKTL